jgi:hypothetical protein
MHQRTIAIIGTVVSLGLFFLTYAKRIADFFAVVHLPHDLEEALKAISNVPAFVAWGCLAIGLFCVAYLVCDYFGWGWLRTKRAPGNGRQDGAATQNPRSDRSEVRAGMIATATVIPTAKYSKAQINRILEAIDAFYPPLGEIEQIMISGTWIAGSLEAIIRDKGAAELLNQMDQLRLKLIDPSNRLDGEVRKFSL